MKHLWRNIYVWLAVAVGVYLGLFLLFPAFNIIDDGASLLVADQLQHDWSGSTWTRLLVEQQVGRFRPLYHLSLFAVYLIFGQRPFFFWLSQALVLFGTLAGMALVLKQVTKTPRLALFSPLLLLFFSPTAENFFRLGTAEPKQVLVWCWLLVVVAAARTKGWTWARMAVFAGLFLAASLIKETSVLFGALMGYVLVWSLVIERRRPWRELVLTSFCAVIAVAVYASIPRGGSYSQGFGLSLGAMWQRLLAARLEYAAVFLPVLLAVLGTGVRFVIEWWGDRKVSWSGFFWQGLLLSQLGLVLVVGILPWQYQLPRYYYPVYVVGLLYVVIEVVAWRSLLPWWQKMSLRGQLRWATAVAIGSWLLQVVVFQSGVDLVAAESVWRQNAWVFSWEAAPLLVSLWLVLGATAVRYALGWNAKQTIKKPWLKLIAWPLWFSAAWLGCSLLSFIPWREHWPRALFVSNLLLGAYVLYEFNQWQQLRRQKWFAKVGVGPIAAFSITAVLVVGMLNQQLLAGRGANLWPFVGPTVTALRQAFDTHQVSYALIRRLLAQTAPGSNVFVSSADYEIIFEIGLYASQFKHRPVTVYTNNQQLIADVGQDFPYLQYVADPITAFSGNTEPRLLLIRKMDWEVLTSTDAAAVPVNLQAAYQAATWQAFSAEEASPAASFGIIPVGANWVLVK